VIGIPVKGGAMDGLDALLSTVQMPGGVPVATVGLGSGGATNAGLLAVHILALSDPQLTAQLKDFREAQKKRVAEMDREVQNEV
jgi:phosphoribosylaminoimidazole carboxylase PurE protein